MRAAPWCPEASLSSDGDRVDSRFVWSALDCPGSFSFPQPEGRILLLGEFAARTDGPIRVGERCVLTSWYLERDGRKHMTGSAVHGEDGACRAVARGTWIEIDPAAVPAF